MTKDKALKLALEALQAYGSHAPNCDHLVLLTSLPPQRKPCSCGLVAAITAIKEALAQPLTLNEMSAIEEKVYMQTTHKGKPLFEYAQALIRATEAAHNIGAKP